MISNQKNYYSLRILALTFLVLVLLVFSFLFVGFQIIPQKLESEVSQSCIHHLKDKSYQIKQFLLENVNNSKLWVKNQNSTFFDSKWFAISFYEHDGREWVLKDFKLNDLVVDIYKISQSEYIKVDQSLIAPSANSEQITMQESKIGDLKVLVLDVPNNLTTLSTNHLIRITLFTDQFTSTLNSNETCALSLMDTKGNFLVQTHAIDESSFLKTMQSGSHEFHEKNVFNSKVLKNLYMLGFVKSDSKMFANSFIQIAIVNSIAIGLVIIIAFKILYQQFSERIQAVNKNIQRVGKKEYNLQFDLSISDELSETEEEVSRLADEARKSKR